VNPEAYIRELIKQVPGIVRDAMDPQILQAELAVDISDNMGDLNKNPVYPRAGGKTLQVVSGKLLRAATVYKGAGNASSVKATATGVTFFWGIDLDVVPYARIHELGGNAGRKLASYIPPRPYITPALKAFSGDSGSGVDEGSFTGGVDGFRRIIKEIYLRLSLIR